MGGPIVRTGTTPAFWENWDKAFGKAARQEKKVEKKTMRVGDVTVSVSVKKTAAKKTAKSAVSVSAKKTAAKKPAKSAKSKSAAKGRKKKK
jgi:hypothetical protein